MQINVYYKKKPNKPGLLGTIRVAGEEITVSRELDLRDSDGTKCDGLYYAQENRILLDAHLKPLAEKQTLLHEIWHAISDKYEIAISAKLEEALAGPIGSGFTTALTRWLPKGPLRPWEEKK